MSNSIECVDALTSDIDWASAPEGATHCLIKDSGTAWFRFKDDRSFPNTWKDGEWKNVRLPTRELTPKPKPKPKPKQLTQAVFDGLPSEYRWAAVDRFGVCAAFTKMPVPAENGSGWRFDDGKMKTLWCSNERRLSYFMIQRQDVPTADIDWSWQEVPAGATHFMRHPTALSFYRSGGDDGWEGYHSKKREWYFLKNTGEFFHKNLLEIPNKPESITDVARSIEAARVAEKSGNRCATCTANICSVIDDCYVQRAKEESARIEEQACMPWPDGDPRYFETSDVPETKKYPHYFKDVSDVDAIDLYHVARLYDITDPALFHAFKKIACAGKRGAKDQAQDVQEAIDALKRWQELNV